MKTKANPFKPGYPIDVENFEGRMCKRDLPST